MSRMRPERRFHTVVVGAGVAGALVAWRLAEAGDEVLLLEAGGEVDRAAGVERLRRSASLLPHVPYPDQAHASRPRADRPADHFVQRGPRAWGALYERQVGGTTWHWAGLVPRMRPADLELARRFGRGVDWPLGWAELEPWYLAAEAALGVAGEEDPDEGPRGGPYPMPPIPMSLSDAWWGRAAAKAGLRVRSIPQARNSLPYDGRPACCGNGSCVPICPIGAKYDGSVHVRKALAAGAQLWTEVVVARVRADSDGLELELLRPDRSALSLRAGRVVLACNTVETALLLLRSDLANSSGQVGRNLMDHIRLAWLGRAREPLHGRRGPVISAHIADPEPERRGERALFTVELLNTGQDSLGDPRPLAARFLAEGLAGEALDRAIREHFASQFNLAAFVEQLPDPTNRVVLAEARDGLGLPRPAVHWQVDDYSLAGLAAARAAVERLLDAAGPLEAGEVQDELVAHHAAGSCRMGTDPATSVVDPALRCHDEPRLSLAGAAVFPTVGVSNPTLTLAALALRLADRLAAEA